MLPRLRLAHRAANLGAVETLCDDLDNDCDGGTDEDLASVECKSLNKYGACIGTDMEAIVRSDHGRPASGREYVAMSRNGPTETASADSARTVPSRPGSRVVTSPPKPGRN